MASATATFVYSAITQSGQKTLGMRSARDRDHLTEELKRRDLLLMKAWRLPGGVALAGVPGETKGLMPLRDQAALNDQLQTLLSRGVTLVEALEVAQSVVSPKSTERVRRLRELVSSGRSFADACVETGGFDKVAIGVYRAAERSGDLTGAAARLAQAAERRLAVRGKAITVLIYPAIVCSVSLILLLVMLIFLVPNLAKSVRDMGTNIPWFSKAIFNLGEFLNANVGPAMLAILGLIIVAIGFRTTLTRAAMSIARRFPAVRDLLLASELTRLFGVLAAMTRTGVPLAEALGVATTTVAHPPLRRQLEDLRTRLVEGGVLRSLIEKVDELPLATRRLLIAAERSGDLDQAFDAMAERSSLDVQNKSSRLLAVLEPAVILGMVLLLGPIIIAIALPMIRLRTGM
ncbi:MAG: type II secretion system F family protein [Phycisphaerales bacterium]|nr:type II secretion system F family protein [Phycisphaerales bacterium]